MFKFVLVYFNFRYICMVYGLQKIIETQVKKKNTCLV